MGWYWFFIYLITDKHFDEEVTLAQVWLVMAEEEKQRAKVGTSTLHDVSGSAFLLLGLDIQNIQ